MLDKIKSLGCQNDMKVMMAYQIYLDLHEVEQLEEISCSYNTELDIIYISAKKNNITDVYVPVHSSFTLSPSWIQNVQNTISVTEPKSMILVIYEGDSTSVRYKLTADLIAPEIPAPVEVKEEPTG